MRLIFLSMLLMLLASCGKDGGSGPSGGLQQQQYDLMWDAHQYEVKDATIDVPASVTDGSIVFNGSATRTDAGDRIKCTVFVNSGDTYHYSISGSRLYLQTPQGNMELKKINSFAGGGIFGVWSHVERTDVGRFENIFSINPTHVVIMKKCEG